MMDVEVPAENVVQMRSVLKTNVLLSAFRIAKGKPAERMDVEISAAIYDLP